MQCGKHDALQTPVLEMKAKTGGEIVELELASAFPPSNSDLFLLSPP
jgi:hypothetical protein